MKKLLNTTIAIIAFMLCFYKANAQSTQTGLGPIGHTALGVPANYYLGWDAATAIPLQIRHDAAQPINFFTAGVPRMTIHGQAGFNQGFLGIGLANPQFRLHIENDGGILSSNNTFGVGTNIPAGLNGPLFIWSPRKASFRAGEDNIGAWSNALTGNYSVAFGRENEI